MKQVCSFFKKEVLGIHHLKCRKLDNWDKFDFASATFAHTARNKTKNVQYLKKNFHLHYFIWDLFTSVWKVCWHLSVDLLDLACIVSQQMTHSVSGSSLCQFDVKFSSSTLSHVLVVHVFDWDCLFSSFGDKTIRENMIVQLKRKKIFIPHLFVKLKD